ncbi:hypothetical protein FNV43_RR00581 [Rhamnella rubrinervis]|uniref:Ubiquitin-like protease family profile domain-containing protein n=1 Tax=Rhamnella rubrinervis TaxID=2594499 RepID=A0A8K0HQX3_9ROSA|nr:hypothetical protein FNV43_RR00581 [Rhamnella rubrinervis]
MEFNFGGSGARFTRQEFGLINGLYRREQPTTRPAPSTRISDTYFGGSKKVTNEVIIRAFHTANCNDDDSNVDDRLKLALLFFLETVVLSKAHKSTAEPNHMEMVDDLKFFNSYPWGTSSFNVTIRSLHAAFEHRCSKTSNNSHTYNIIGFPMPFMYDVIGMLEPTEDEQAFVSSIAWPVKESRYPGPPIVQDKTLSPNGHNNTCTTAIREKKRKKTKVAIEGSKKARRIGIPVFTSPLSRKSPFVCRDRSSADSSHRRKSHDIPKLSSIVQKLSHLEDEITGLRGQVTQLNTKVFSIEDRLSHIEDMITRVETKECAVYDKIPGLETMLSKILGLLQEACPTVQVDDASQRPHNSDREQPDLDDVHGAYDDDGHKANFDDATGYATNDVRIDKSEDVEKQSNKDVRGDSTLVDKQLLFSPILSPLPLQSTPLMVNTKADLEASVEVLTYVSPSKVAKGKRKRRAAHYITSTYDVASLHRSMRLTFPQGTQKFDPFSSVRDCIIQQYKQFMESSGKPKIYIDSIKAGKKFFQLLEKDAAWIEDSHIEILTYLFRQRADKYPSIFDRCTLLLDCRLGILLPLNKDNKHWLLGAINLKSRHVQLYDPKKWGYTEDFYINYFEPRICQMLPYLLRCVQFFKVWMDISNSLKPFKVSLADCPQQKIDGDCGIFVLKYMEYLSAGRDMDFTSNDISFFRMKFTLKERRAPDVATEISGSIVVSDNIQFRPCQAPDISPEVKPDDIGFQTTFNLGHVRRLTLLLKSLAPDKAPNVGPDICGSIILKISLSQALVYVIDVKPEDIGFDNSKDLVGGGS